MPAQWQWTLFKADNRWQLLVWNVPPEVDFRSVAVFVQHDSSTLALTLDPLSRPVPDHASLLLRMPVSGALPLLRMRRKTFQPCTRACLLTWTVNRNENIPRDFLLHHLIIQCDGSGGERWGVGVHIPSLRYACKFGGDAAVLPQFLANGEIDSATVEAMAVACALHVAAHVLQKRTFNAVLLVVDNTSLASREMSSPTHVSDHHRAVLRHVYRRAEILLLGGYAVLVMHKKLFGLRHSWAPDQFARQGRGLQNPPFGQARATSTPVKFVRGAHGNFKGQIGRDGLMVASVLCTYEIAFGERPRRPCPVP